MDFNLIDLVKDQFNSSVLVKLGDMLGGSEAQNQLAIISAIPGILSGLINSAATGEGAESLLTTISGQDDSVIDNLNDLLGSEQQSSVLEMGTNAVAELFGESNSENLISAVSDYSGSLRDRSGHLIGFITPIILSVIKRKLLDDHDDLNISNVTTLLNNQKENVHKAMPFGFSDQLEYSNFGTLDVAATDKLSSDDIGFKKTDFKNLDVKNTDLIDNDSIMPDKLDTIDFEINELESDDKFEVSTNKVVGKKKKNIKFRNSKFLKLLLIGLLLGAGYIAYDNFFKGSKLNQLTNSGFMETLATDGLSQELASAFGNLNKIFSNISDLDSAKASIPKLNTIIEKIGDLAGLIKKLPEKTKVPLVKIVEGYLPLIQNELNKLGIIPGVGEVLKPSLDSLNSKLALFKK